MSGTKILGYPKVCHYLCANWRVAKKLGYPKKCHYLCANYRAVESRDIPKRIYGDLLPDVTRSVTGFGQRSGKWHFAKRVSPLRVNHWKWLYNIYQSGLNTYHLQDRTAEYLLFSPEKYDFPLNMKSMQKSWQGYLSLLNDKISRVFGGNSRFEINCHCPKCTVVLRNKLSFRK